MLGTAKEIMIFDVAWTVQQLARSVAPRWDRQGLLQLQPVYAGRATRSSRWLLVMRAVAQRRRRRLMPKSCDTTNLTGAKLFARSAWSAVTVLSTCDHTNAKVVVGTHAATKPLTHTR